MIWLPSLRFRCLLPVLLLAQPIPPAVCAGETRPPEIAGIEVGFAGRYKTGLWTPLRVTLRGGDSDAEGRVRASMSDGDGLNCAFESTEIRLPAGKDIEVPLCVRFGREANSLLVELVRDGRALTRRTFDSAQTAGGRVPDSLRPGQRLIVSIGGDVAGFDDAVPGSQGPGARNVVAAIGEPARLPACWQGYEGVDVVIVSTSRRKASATLARSSAQLQALDQWIRIGGTLVLCAGANAEQDLSAGSPLADFLPGSFQKTEILRRTGGWETLAKSMTPLPAPQAGEKVELPIARLAASPTARIEAREADLPLVIRQRRSLGSVVFVATDLDRGPMRAWSDRPLLMAAILDLPLTEPGGASGSAVESFGFNDLAGQLRSSLEDFRGLSLPPFFAVAGLAVVYILLIGPADYFLLRRLGRGMYWTWLTFPAVIVLFVAGVGLAVGWLKGGEVRVNQIDVIDLADDGAARGASWFGVFSPRQQSFDLSVRPILPGGRQPQQALASLAWFGKAGNEFNGMYARGAQTTSPLGSPGYSAAPSLDGVYDVPIPVGSAKSFCCRWLGRTEEPALDIALVEEEKQLVGAVTNRLSGPQGQGGVVLSGAHLVYDGWVYPLGELRPGETIEVGSLTPRFSLSTFLSAPADASGRPPAKKDIAPYDHASRDAAYILRAMLFYDAAGGRKRTGMANQYQGHVDLSGLLKTGTAVLVAMPPREAASRGAELLCGPAPAPGEPDRRRSLSGPLDNHTVVYRFIVTVLPAGRAAAGPRPTPPPMP